MATWTGAQLAAATLKKLRRVAAGQTATAADLAVVTDAWASKYPQLRRDGLVPFDDDAIAEWAQQPLVKVMSAEVAIDFGFGGQRLLELKTEGEIGERELRRQVAPARQPVPVEFEDF